MESKNEEKNSDKEIEKKLSDLLNIGWILLDEKCPLETCDCPLLKSFDGNKYCVKCEMWQFPDQVKVKHGSTASCTIRPPRDRLCSSNPWR